MLKYDSVHGKFEGDVEVKDGKLLVNGNLIRITAERDPANLKWDEVGAEYVIESTGFFLTEETAGKHLEAGAKKVVLSAPSKDHTPMFVMGVNNTELKADQKIFSNASCTTNCLAPITKVLNDNFGIVEGLMTTVHAATATQKTVDGPSMKDWRGGRSSIHNIIPSSTGAAKAVGLVMPHLSGKLDGTAIRVPTPNVSLIDFKFVTNKKISKESINKAMTAASKSKKLKGILNVNSDPLVSSDFNHNSASSTFDLTQTQVIDESFGRVLSWYDNEWGFSNRMCDTAVKMNNTKKND